jgi:hypothetical protein
MSIKNKDLSNLMEEYGKIFSNIVVLKEAASDQEANKMAGGNLKALEQEPEDETDSMQDLEVISKAGYKRDLATSKVLSDAPNLDTWSYKTLQLAINAAFVTKEPLLILGDPGIGKSDTVRSFAEQISRASTRGEYIKQSDYSFGTQKFDANRPEEEEGSSTREYVDWAEIDETKKLDVLNNPQNYFVILELTATELDRLDIKGLPELGKSEYGYQKYIKGMELYLMTRPNLEGFVFLDEVNLGTVDVRSALLKVIQKRTVADDKLSPGLAIVAASNIPGRGVDSEPLSAAFLGRQTGGIGILTVDPDGWCDWAESVGVDERVINFIKENPDDYFYTTENLTDIQSEQRPFASPRAFVAFSKMYKKAIQDYVKAIKSGVRPEYPFEKYVIERGAKITGRKWVESFMSWVDEIKNFNLDEVLKQRDLGKKDRGSIKTAKIGQIVYNIKSRLRTAANKLVKDGVHLDELDEDTMNEAEVVAFLTQHINGNPEVFKIFEGAAKVLARTNIEWAGILLRGILSQFPEVQKRLFIAFLQYGNYDPATKADINEPKSDKNPDGGVFEQLGEFAI